MHIFSTRGKEGKRERFCGCPDFSFNKYQTNTYSICKEKEGEGLKKDFQFPGLPLNTRKVLFLVSRIVLIWWSLH